MANDLDLNALLRDLAAAHPGARLSDVLSNEQFEQIARKVSVDDVRRTRGDLRRAITCARHPNPAEPGPDARAWYDAHSTAIENALAAFEQACIAAGKVV